MNICISSNTAVRISKSLKTNRGIIIVRLMKSNILTLSGITLFITVFTECQHDSVRGPSNNVQDVKSGDCGGQFVKSGDYGGQVVKSGDCEGQVVKSGDCGGQVVKSGDGGGHVVKSGDCGGHEIETRFPTSRTWKTLQMNM